MDCIHHSPLSPSKAPKEDAIIYLYIINTTVWRREKDKLQKKNQRTQGPLFSCLTAFQLLTPQKFLGQQYYK